MKTIASLCVLLLLLAIGGVSAQTLDGAGLTLSSGGSESLDGSVVVNSGSTGAGIVKVGGGTLVLSSDPGSGVISGVLTLNSFTDPGNGGTNLLLPATLSGSGGTLNLTLNPGVLSLDTVYEVDLSNDFILDPDTTSGLTFTLQATPEPPSALLLAISLIAGAGAIMFRSFRSRGSARSA